jgi:hypothetical protein
VAGVTGWGRGIKRRVTRWGRDALGRDAAGDVPGMMMQSAIMAARSGSLMALACRAAQSREGGGGGGAPTHTGTPGKGGGQQRRTASEAVTGTCARAGARSGASERRSGHRYTPPL